MEERKDSATVLDWLQRSGVQDSFDTSGLEFSVRIYGKGEIITSPDKPADNLMFIAEGSGEIYGIRQDGSLNPVALVSAPGIIGDFEFIGTGGTPFYVEARTAMICIVLHSGQSRSRLMADPCFLYMLLMSIADKFSMLISIEGVEGTARTGFCGICGISAQKACWMESGRLYTCSDAAEGSFSDPSLPCVRKDLSCV